MMWLKGILLAFWLVFSPLASCWAGGYWINEKQLTALEDNLNRQIGLLSAAEKELSLLSEKLKESELSLELSGKELEKSREDLEKSETSLGHALESYKKLEGEMVSNIFIAGVVGLAVGIIAGLLLPKPPAH